MSARTAEVAGRRVGVVELGDGAPLAWMHGFADIHGVLEGLAPFHEALAARRRLIAPAHPGCAESDEYPDLERIEDAVFYYLELFDALELDRFDLAGHCVGGWIAAEFAARHPERVASLTLLGASGLFVPGEPTGDVFMMAQPARGVDYGGLRELLFADEASPLARALFPDGRGAIDDELRRYRMLRFASFIGFRPPYFYHPALAGRLHRVRCPALVLWGEHDRLVPRAHGELYAEKLPGARELQVIAGAGHAAHLEMPDETAEAVAGFLAGAAAASA